MMDNGCGSHPSQDFIMKEDPQCFQ
jgi:hypothetical protein